MKCLYCGRAEAESVNKAFAALERAMPITKTHFHFHWCRQCAADFICDMQGEHDPPRYCGGKHCDEAAA